MQSYGRERPGEPSLAAVQSQEIRPRLNAVLESDLAQWVWLKERQAAAIPASGAPHYLALAGWLVVCFAAAPLAAFRGVNRTAYWLLAPYLAWVSFAAGLNFALWRPNS